MLRFLRIFLALITTSCVIMVAQPTSVTLRFPAGGETFRAGVSYDIRWDTTGTNGSRFLFQFATNVNGPWTNIALPNNLQNVLDSTTIPSGNVGGRGQYLGGFRAPAVPTTTGYLRMVLLNRDLTPNLNVTSRNQVEFTITQPTPTPVDSILTGNITGSVTLSPFKIYGLSSFVFVQNGGVLRIPAGTIIVGDAPGVNSAIVINRGGKIFAKGTADKPIVFTSRAPAGQRDRGDWGGIVLCGRARTNHPGGEATMEGFPSDPVNARFGGGANPDDDDSSGVLSFVRIEFGGIAFFSNQEINGITLNAVGRKTVLDHIQVSYSGDDSFEWFGGTVDGKYLISYSGFDDDFDTDNGYSGRNQFVLSKRFRTQADGSTSQLFESDNDASGSRNEPVTRAIFSNVTAIGPLQDTSWIAGSGANQFNRLYGSSTMIRRNSRMSLFNSVIIGWTNTLEFGGPNAGFSADAASRDSLQIRNVSYFGIKAGSPGWRNAVPAGTTSFSANWLLSPANSNEVINNSGNIASYSELPNTYFENNNFNAIPTPNASYLASASFAGRGAVGINDPFFDVVPYRGAFAPDASLRWDAQWAEYDPINKEYKALRPVQLTYPAGGEKFNVGQVIDVRWDSVGTLGNRYKLQFGTSPNGPWTDAIAEIVDQGTTRGTVKWTIPNAVTKTGFVRLQSLTDASINSQNPFGFEISVPVPVVRLIRPAGGETFRAGTSQTLQWDTTNTNGSRFRFEFGTSATGPWTPISLPGTNTFVLDSSRIPSGFVGGRGTYAGGFRVPAVPTTTGYIRMMILKSDNTPDEASASINATPFTITQPQPITPDSIISGNITGSLTLSAFKTYGISGYVWVQNGGVLRIEPGTIIYGDAPGINSALIINRGAKIYAKGTDSLPIIFTSRAPAGQRDRGDWGGIVLCGRARINNPGGEATIEGFPSDATNARFGGGANADDNDSSGVMSYVRIEFGGIALFSNQEINGLTLAAVGRKTVLDHIQVSYSGDDSFEWFGGTVDGKYLISYNGFDDDFDTDNGYSGRNQFLIGKRFRQVADGSTSQMFESDNDASGSRNEPLTSALFSNVTAIGPVQDTSWVAGSGANQFNRLFGAAMMIRRNSRQSILNSVFVGWTNTLEFGGPNAGFTADAASRDSVQIRNNTFIGIKAGSPGWRNAVPAGTTSFSASWLTSSNNANLFENKQGSIDAYDDLNNGFIEASNQFDVTPTTGSQLYANPSFSRRGTVAIDDAFFTPVTYRGAFEPGITRRWDARWTEYDPVGKEYKARNPKDTMTSVLEQSDDVLTASIAPNPTSSYAKIRYQLSKPSTVSIVVMDNIGNEVARIADGLNQESAVYEFMLNPSVLANGIYFVRIITTYGATTLPLSVVK